MKQHDKIIKLCQESEWVCGNTFRANFIFSMHKRMIEIEGRKNKDEPITGKYYFEARKCEHGHKLVHDYKIRLNENKYRKVDYYVPALNKHIIKIEAITPPMVGWDIQPSPETQSSQFIFGKEV